MQTKFVHDIFHSLNRILAGAYLPVGFARYDVQEDSMFVAPLFYCITSEALSGSLTQNSSSAKSGAFIDNEHTLGTFVRMGINPVSHIGTDG